MTEINYNFYHWGPFLFHSTMDKEFCKLILEEGLKVRGKSDELYVHKLAGHLNEQNISRDTNTGYGGFKGEDIVLQ